MTPPRAGRWEVHRLAGPAGALHARPWPSPPVPAVWVLEVTGPALVLGSTQPASDAPAGIEVVRRRSGGGAVLLRPGSPVWLDVLVPRSDGRWDDDVGRAFAWLGATWVEALDGLGVGGGRAHSGPFVHARWSRQVCFAGLGPGEVTVAGRKVVGISQRRTRDGALLQCAALLDWDPASIVAALGLPPAAEADLAPAASGIPTTAGALVEAFLAALSTR